VIRLELPMRKVIMTKIISPTELKGLRIRASTKGTYITIPWVVTLSDDENHIEAARKLASHLKWPNAKDLIGGYLPDGCAVFL
jgi:hypothetical protein